MNRWSVSDLIDLEFFALRDEEQSQAELEQRDREIYQRSVMPKVGANAGSKSFRHTALTIWLSEMRTHYQRDGAVLPGEIFTDARRLVNLILVVIGLISGAGLALSMLVYNGQEPVNVSVYFGVLVVMQILMVLLTLRFCFIRTSPAGLKKYSVIYPLLGDLLRRMLYKLIRGAGRHLSAGQKQSMEAVFGVVMAKHTLYSCVIFWTVFALVQALGIAFNLGVMAATFIRVFTADLAFGWQSTVQLSSQAVHNLVSIVAAPWAWIVPAGIACPSLAQIEGSRMVLKDGIYHLVTADLVSWWPFLLCAVCTYGLLPRVILYGAALLEQRISVSRLDLSTAGFDRLIMRMTRPAMSTSGAAVGGRPGMVDEGAGVQGEYEASKVQGIPSAVLMSSDIIGLADEARLRGVVAATLGWKVVSVSAIQGETVSDRQVLDSLSGALGKEIEGVIVVLEAWQPPIVETIEFIRALRQSLGQRAPIVVLLIGKPFGQDIFTPVDRPDREVWDRAIRRLADPWVRLEAVEGAG